MSGVSRIRETKNCLRTAMCRITEDLDFETTTFETEILPGTMVCAELKSREYDSYRQLSLLWVETIKDEEKREVILPNISRFIFRELKKDLADEPGRVQGESRKIPGKPSLFRLLTGEILIIIHDKTIKP
ncbi:MAG: hypothetical protein LUD15_09970 [Bacteroides sp.]|nr:hypothetical protein [Bacteroides sp.]